MHCFLGQNKNWNESIEGLTLIRKLLWIFKAVCNWIEGGSMAWFYCYCNIWWYKILLRVSCKASHCYIVTWFWQVCLRTLLKTYFMFKDGVFGFCCFHQAKSWDTPFLALRASVWLVGVILLYFTAACDQHGVNTLVIGDKLDDICLVTVWLFLRIHKCVQANGPLSCEDLTAQNELELWIYSACKTSAGINNWESKGLSVVLTSGTYGSRPAPYLPFLWKWSQLHSQIITHQAIKSHGWLERGEKV